VVPLVREAIRGPLGDRLELAGRGQSTADGVDSALERGRAFAAAGKHQGAVLLRAALAISSRVPVSGHFYDVTTGWCKRFCPPHIERLGSDAVRPIHNEERTT
jgi:hypothetical protein